MSWLESPSGQGSWAAKTISATPKNPNEYQFATFVSDRRPQFKIHRTLGQAHGAISYRTRTANYRVTVVADCAVYRRVADEWQIVYAFNRGSVWRCLPWQKDEGSPEKRLAEDAIRRIQISVADLQRQIAHSSLNPELSARLHQECQDFRKRIQELTA